MLQKIQVVPKSIHADRLNITTFFFIFFCVTYLTCSRPHFEIVPDFSLQSSVLMAP